MAMKEPVDLKSVFLELAKKWRLETAAYSSAEMIAMHPSYQQIIGMGPDALPLILNELSREPGQWFWALSVITRENPVKPEDAGDITRMTEAWLQLGHERGWI